MRFDRAALTSGAIHGQGSVAQQRSQAVDGYGDASNVEAVDATSVLQQLQSQMNHVSAAVRQITSRLTNIEQAVGTVANNHATIAQHVNKLKTDVGTIGAWANGTAQQMAVLQKYARGGGVTRQQYVPARANDTVIAYDMPQRNPSAGGDAVPLLPASMQIVQPELVDPGTENAAGDGTEISYDDAMFHGLIEDDDS